MIPSPRGSLPAERCMCPDAPTWIPAGVELQVQGDRSARSVNLTRDAVLYRDKNGQEKQFMWHHEADEDSKCEIKLELNVINTDDSPLEVKSLLRQTAAPLRAGQRVPGGASRRAASPHSGTLLVSCMRANVCECSGERAHDMSRHHLTQLHPNACARPCLHLAVPRSPRPSACCCCCASGICARATGDHAAPHGVERAWRRVAGGLRRVSS